MTDIKGCTQALPLSLTLTDRFKQRGVAMYRIAIAGALLLGACSGKPPTAAPQQQIFKEQQAALAKAKSIEKTVQDGAVAQKQQIDAETGK